MTDLYDPKGLIREAFRMDDIGGPECRTIFLDWALGAPPETDVKQTIAALLEIYACEPQDHPMITTLKEALADIGPAKRRGGRQGRLQS